jgi:hypothetical protein
MGNFADILTTIGDTHILLQPMMFFVLFLSWKVDRKLNLLQAEINALKTQVKEYREETLRLRSLYETNLLPLVA